MHAPDPHRLRLLSYNMQLGIRSRHYGDYLLQSWRHLLPPRHASRHLEPIAAFLRNQDLVAVQEADAGSWRTRSINLVHFLAERAQYPHWECHNHRQIGRLARHAMGLLSRIPLTDTRSMTLPGRVPGRAALHSRLQTCDANGTRGPAIHIIATHLALGESDRRRQLSYLHDHLADAERVILLGDLNCESDELRRHPFLREREMLGPADAGPTFPSWKPSRMLDHILHTPGLQAVAGQTLDFAWSDHLPVAMTLELPYGLRWAPP